MLFRGYAQRKSCCIQGANKGHRPMSEPCRKACPPGGPGGIDGRVRHEIAVRSEINAEFTMSSFGDFSPRGLGPS